MIQCRFGYLTNDNDFLVEKSSKIPPHSGEDAIREVWVDTTWDSLQLARKHHSENFYRQVETVREETNGI